MLWSAAPIRKPETQKVTKKSLLVLQRCKYKKKPTSMNEVRKAIEAMVGEMDKRKYKNGVWVMFPTWGDVEPDLDFQILARYDSFDELGNAWGRYAPGTDAHTTVENATGNVFSGKVTRVSFSTVLRCQSEEQRELPISSDHDRCLPLIRRQAIAARIKHTGD